MTDACTQGNAPVTTMPTPANDFIVEWLCTILGDPDDEVVRARLVMEWLCALFGEPDAEAVKAYLVGEVVRRRGVDAETAWAWVEGRDRGDTGHEVSDPTAQRVWMPEVAR